MAVTIVDIAKRVNMSPSTVSLAISGKKAGKRRIAPGTVELVRRVAREMGYRPNMTARSLRHGRTYVVAVMQGGFRGGSDDPRLDGIDQVLNPTYSSTVAVHKYDSNLERMHLNSFMESRLDGVIASPTGDPENIGLYRELIEVHGIPLVCLDRDLEGLEVPVVATDAVAFVHNATRSLLELGHERIVFASQVSLPATTSKNREGYRKAMREAGLEEYIHIIRLKELSHVTSNTEECKKAAGWIMDQWQQRLQGYTAVLVAFDSLGYSVLDECDSRGIRVPEDLSVMSLGDWVSSSLGRISLSSVAEDLERMGRAAARLMLEMIDGTKPSQLQFLYPGEVKLRRTTGRLLTTN